MDQKIYSPYKILVIITASIFVSEALIMYLLSYFPPFPKKVEMFLDALFLVMFIAPFLYFFLFRPLVNQVNQLQKAEEEMKAMNSSLEEYASNMEQLAKERSKQLIHSERMATLGTMSAGVAHEINNPTNYISTNVQMFETFWDQHMKVAMEKAKGREEGEKIGLIIEKAPKMLKDMKKGVKRITAIVQDLSNFSRKIETKLEETSLCDCIDSALKFCQFDQHVKHKLKVQRNLQECLPMVKMHRQEIEQIFINLFTNAVHAMEENKDGKESILQVSANQDNESVVIKITDTGHGMNEETLADIFNPFYTTKDVGKGTGLGLSICHGIIEHHRGSINASSTLGEGTTFAITLPIDPEKKDRRQEVAQQVQGSRRKEDLLI